MARRDIELDQEIIKRVKSGQRKSDIARDLGVTRSRVSKAIKREGHDHRWQYQQSHQEKADRVFDMIPQENLEQLLNAVRNMEEFNQLSQRYGFEGCYLASYALRVGISFDDATKPPDRRSEWLTSARWMNFSERISEVGSEMRFVSGFRDYQGELRGFVVCAECESEGGCGHAPQLRTVTTSGKRGAGLCMRRAKQKRGDELRLSPEEARRRIEESGYWRMLEPEIYGGNKTEVLLICPEGHIDRYIYAKALHRDRCRKCGGKFAQQICIETLHRMFGGEWKQDDRSYLKHALEQRDLSIVLEIDGLCLTPERHYTAGPIAVSHDGPQHFGNDVGKGRGRQDLDDIMRRDELRDEILAELGVPFIRVSDLTFWLSHLSDENQKNVFQHIEQAVSAAGLQVPDYERFDIRCLSAGRFAEYKKVAERLGVVILDEECPDARGSMRYHCPRHNVQGVTVPAIFGDRKTCCDRGEAERLRQTNVVKREARIQEVEKRSGLHHVGGLPSSANGSTLWICGENLHQFNRTLLNVEKRIKNGDPHCLKCEELKRKGISDDRCLTARRHKIGASIEELAKMSGLSRAQIGHYEDGQPMPCHARRKLARVFCCGPGSVLDNPQVRPPTPCQNTLKRLCKKAGISLAELGRRVGKSDGHISNIASGKVVLKRDLAMKIAEILGVSPNDLGLSIQEEKVSSPLALARVKVGLSQVQLAEMIGVDKVTMHLIEVGKRGVQLELADRIGRAVGVEPNLLKLRKGRQFKNRRQ